MRDTSPSDSAPKPVDRRLLLLATAVLCCTASARAAPAILNRASPSLPDPAGGGGQLYPAALIETPDSLRRAVVVDAARSELHLLEKRGKQWVRSVTYPVAVGRNGVGKTAEGDQRTPLGIYAIVDRKPGHKLSSFYGPGALVLDYPNELDRRDGRTGSNIWIHGMPPDQASAPTRSSSGCLVLANAHVQALWDALGSERTTVLIAKQLEWVHPSSGDPEGRVLKRRLEAWRKARSDADAEAAWGLYATKFSNFLEDAELWRRGIAAELQAIGPHPREIRDLSMLAWNDSVRLVSFTESLAGMRRGLLRRQYWSAEEGEWRIFSEGVYE